jgi:N-acetylated-alpha-linked acidic dipeptidase
MLGELHKQGWQPKRTIIYCAWDGEEPGLLGSVEWVETHMDDLQKHAVAYINSDGNGRGYFRASGSHDLEHFINEVARDIMDPEKNISVFQRSRLQRIARASNAEDRGDIRKRSDLRIGSLGDGSDYTAFLDHAGISALNIGYGGETDADQYHSIYDDFYWYTHFVDTDFVYGRALAQTGGTAVMRLANAEILPYDYVGLSDTIDRYIKELEKLLKEKQDEITERNKELEEGVFTATADPKKTSVPPPAEAVPPFMNFAPLKNGSELIKRNADRYKTAFDKALAPGAPALSPDFVNSLNLQLIEIQRTFLTPQGLPERPWFKHQVYAPGAYTGYGAKPIAAVREYMDQKKWKEADGQVPMVGTVLEQVGAAIGKAADNLDQQVNRKP